MSTAQRVVLRLVSALLALTLIVGSVLLVGEILVQLTGGENLLLPTDEWVAALRRTPWGSAAVVYAALAFIVAGLLLLAVVLLTRPRLFHLARPADDVQVMMPPRAVAQMLRRQAETVAGVATASAEVDRDLARISVTAPLADPRQVEQELAAALTHALKKIPWVRIPRLEIDVAAAQDRRPTPVEAEPGAGAR